MATQATTGTVTTVRLNSAGGQITSIDVTFAFTDSAGNTYGGAHTFALTAGQQAHLANFVADVLAAIAAVTGLTLSMA